LKFLGFVDPKRDKQGLAAAMSAHSPQPQAEIPLEPLPRTPQREALGAMGGYDYQIWRSIESWVMLADDEVLFLEGAEDIDRVSSSETTTVQVKRTEGGVSLNSQNARDAIRNFWATVQRSPTRQVKFVYLTTSSIAKERDARFGGLAGIEAWGKAAFDPVMAEAVRQQLIESLEDDQPIQEFLTSATVHELQTKLLQRLTWLTGQPDVEVVEQTVLERIGDVLVMEKQPRSAARAVKNELLAYCWKQVLKPSPDERKLDKTSLWLQIEKATTVTLEMPLNSAGALLVAAAQLSSLQENFANLALLQGTPPSPPRALLRRQALVDAISERVIRRDAVLLVGSVFKGKTTIAQVVARDAGLNASWTELSGRTPAATSEALKLLAFTIDRPDGPSLLILDDLDTSANARRVYASSLRQLVHRASVAGVALLFTAQGHTEALEQEVAASWGVEVVVVPAMSQAEVAQHCVNFGCSSLELANAWSQLIAVQSGGHPALVHVRLVELRDQNWPPIGLATFVTPSPGTQSAKQMARELLDTSVSPEASQFALEAGEFMVAPTREMLLNLAGLPPKLTGAQAILTTLTGRWLEELGNGRYRVTQILRGEVNITWTAEQHRAVHAKIFDSIFSCKSITPNDGGALVFHAFIALDTVRFLHSVMSVLTADDEVQRRVFSHCSWVLHVDFDNGPVRIGLKSAMPYLRQLQFLVAEVEDPSRIEEFARAWRGEIGPRVSDVGWTLSRVMYDMTVLSKHVALPMEVVLDGVSSAVQTQEPAASVIAAGIAKIKAMPALPGFAPPESATLFQFFLSLRAGGVRTLRDFNCLLEFLSNPTNKALADQFDEMLNWQHVRDLGAFVHSGWVTEAGKDSPDWSLWLEAFDRALAVCESCKLPLYGAQVARAKSIVLSEYAGDISGGLTVLDRATEIFGPSAVIEEQRINLMGQSEEHGLVLSAWDATIARFGSQAVTDLFAYRRVAISAAKLGQFDRASQLFEQGARQPNDRFEPTRVGLLIDASYCALQAGQLRRCSALLTEAVLMLPPKAWAEGDKRWEAIIQVANATAQLFEYPGQLLPNGKPLEIAFGRASQPDLAVDELTPGQAIRVGLLETQVAFLEAHWPDASSAMFDRVSILLRGNDLNIRFNGSKSFILRELVGGTSPNFLRYLMDMFDVAGELKIRSGAPSTVTVMPAEQLSGMLAIGLLLASGAPNELLEHWITEACDANTVDVLSILERFQAGLTMSPNAAATEAIQFVSRDPVVNVGAAVRICHANDVQARTLVVASLRVAATVRWGITPFFAHSIDAPIARFLAEQLNQQTRLPAQFSVPSVAVPTITQTVRLVRTGDAGLKELLMMGCSVTGINPGDTLKLL
jgi:hypothetical protein